MAKLKRFIHPVVSAVLLVSLFFFSVGFGSADTQSIIIKKGDTLYSLSKRYNISVQELKEFNHLKSNLIYTGQKLLIPGIANESLYVVLAGSFIKKENAEKRVAFLKKNKIDAIIVEKVISGKKFYRIQAGVFSVKENAEKLRGTLKNKGIKDAYIFTERPLHINRILVGSTYNQVLEQFGKPLKTEDHLTIRSLYYLNEGAGVRVNFNMENGSVFGLQVYPEYLKGDSIPKVKSEVLSLYGHPNEVKEVTCYESASCEQLVYTFNKNKLIVQIDRDGKSVQYLDLGRVQ